MYKVILKDGTEYIEGRVRWADVPKEEVARLESDFGGKIESICIPEGAKPIVFNTAEAILNTGVAEQISQSIGYEVEGKRFLITITAEGQVTKGWE